MKAASPSAPRDDGAASPLVPPPGVGGAADTGGRKLSSFERHLQGGLPRI